MDSYQLAHERFVSATRRQEPPTPAGQETSEEARAKRRQLALFIGSELIRLAGSIPGTGTDVGNPSELAVSTVINMVGELIFGAQVLIENELYYAEASGHREIIEIANLLRYFALDIKHAERWQRSTDADFRSSKSEFKPVVIRRRLSDATTHYDTHCSLGGHPRPTGRVLLSNHDLHHVSIDAYSPVVDRVVTYTVADSMQCDLLQHARHACHAVSGAAEALNLEKTSTDIIDELILSAEIWVHTDALAVVDADDTGRAVSG
jgi:hypothetical protein